MPHLRLRTLLLAILGATWLTTSGCDWRQVRDPFDDWSAAFSIKADPEPVHAFEAAGPLSLDVELFAGSVTVEVDPDATQAIVLTERSAAHGERREAEAQASLDEIGFTAEVTAGELSPVLRLRATTEHAEPHNQRVDVHVVLPAADGARVHTTGGDITLTGIAGELDLSTSNGDVMIITMQPVTKPVTIVVNRRGSIDYRVTGLSTGAFDCRSTYGHVYTRMNQGIFIVDRGTTGNELLGSLNDGENAVTMRSTYGDIGIAVIEEPSEFGAFLVDGR